MYIEQIYKLCKNENLLFIYNLFIYLFIYLKILKLFRIKNIQDKIDK